VPALGEDQLGEADPGTRISMSIGLASAFARLILGGWAGLRRRLTCGNSPQGSPLRGGPFQVDGVPSSVRVAAGPCAASARAARAGASPRARIVLSTSLCREMVRLFPNIARMGDSRLFPFSFGPADPQSVTAIRH
jgi:hypothetical protein